MHDVATEKFVVGALLLGPPRVRSEILSAVTATDMWLGQHRTITEAVADMHVHGATVDMVTVTDELERRGDAMAVYVTECMSSVPTSANGVFYARRVAGLARRRRVAQAAQALLAAASDATTDLDSAVADCTDALAHTHAEATAVESAGLVDGALEAFERGDEPLGWGAPWKPLSRSWRIVPGWVHVVTGSRSAGKSSLLDALLVGLADRARSLVWSPEGAPSSEHLLRMASIQAGSTFRGQSSGDVVEHLAYVSERVRWLPHESVTKLPQLLAAADAHRARNRLDILLVDPFTSLDKFDGDEAWDRMLNRHLSRLQGWARSRAVAVIVVAHPKQRDRQRDGTRPIATDADIHGGIMWGNQADSLVSVWRDETGKTRPPELVDVHVQKIRHDGPGGRMGRMATLRRDDAGRYFEVAA